jgi:DNA modification methylase
VSLNRVAIGDCRETLKTFEPSSVQCVITSPPYWGLRDYDNPLQIGLESTPDAYVATMVEVFRELWRVLRDDGVVWLNIGDSYITKPHGNAGRGSSRPATNGRGEPQAPGAVVPIVPKRLEHEADRHRLYRFRSATLPRQGPPRAPRTAGEASSTLTNPERQERVIQHHRPNDSVPEGLKHKDRVMIPARVALALQADGWWLRDEVIWHKPNPMPESMKDRTTKAHETVYLLSKSEHYFYDRTAILEPAVSAAAAPELEPTGKLFDFETGALVEVTEEDKRNARSVWSIPTTPFKGAHFAVFPFEIAKRCMLAGSRIGDTVLDPFLGSGTVAQVAEDLGRRWLGCELNPAYLELIERRTAQRGLLSWSDS